jgi:hypothetical protein
MPYRTDRLETLYRRFRADQAQGLLQGWTYSHRVGAAVTALQLAREELALQRAEGEDRIRFIWEYDADIDAACEQDPPEAEAECRAKVAAGEWEALGCIVELPKRCKHCGNVIEDEWTQDASLWGIVIDVADRYGYKREVERELAAEAGVI